LLYLNLTCVTLMVIFLCLNEAIDHIYLTVGHVLWTGHNELWFIMVVAFYFTACFIIMAVSTTLWMSLSGPDKAQTWTRLNISGEIWKWLCTDAPHPTWWSLRGSAKRNGRNWELRKCVTCSVILKNTFFRFLILIDLQWFQTNFFHIDNMGYCF